MPRPFARNARILIVDDEEMNIRFLTRILEPEGHFDLDATTDPRDVVTLFRRCEPDLVMLDLKMPYMDGLDVLDVLRPEIPEGTYLPILVLTSDVSTEAKRRALSGGAKDFLTKPLSPSEVRLRVQNLLEARFLHLELQEQNRELEARVRERTAQLEEARIEVLERLARAAEFRDDDTGQHAQRVGRTAALLATTMGLSSAAVELVRRAAPLHDIGKIGVPDSVLLKRGRLTPSEYELMKRHTVIGSSILSGSRLPLLKMGQEIALTHHERWDGAGYPNRLSGEAIPLVGRLVAVADVFDALIHDRPYKPAWPVPDAVAEIGRDSGRQFDPNVVAAFTRLYWDGALDGSLGQQAPEVVAERVAVAGVPGPSGITDMHV